MVKEDDEDGGALDRRDRTVRLLDGRTDRFTVLSKMYKLTAGPLR